MSSVHQVAVKNTNAVGAADWVMKSRDEFSTIPGPEQIELVLKGNVKFYDDKGEVIPSKEAIKSIGLM